MSSRRLRPPFRLAVLLGALCAGAAGAAAAAAAAPPASPSPTAVPVEAAPVVAPRYYLTYFGGRPVSVTREDEEAVTLDGRPAVRVRARERMRLVVERTLREVELERDLVLRPDGELVSLVQRESAGGQTKSLRIEVRPDRVIFRERLDAAAPRETVVAREGWLGADLDGRVLAARGALVDGGTVTVLVVAVAERGLASLTARVSRLAPAATGLPAGARFRAEVENTGHPETTGLIFLDAAGGLVERRVAGITVRRVSAAEARLPERAAELSNRIPFDGRIIRPSRAREIQLDFALPENTRQDLFPELPSQSARWEAGGARCRLTLRETSADGSLPDAPLAAEERAAYLAPTLLVQADDPRIVARARRIVGDADAPLRRARLLADWVGANLRGATSPVAQSSAVEALAAGRGDCTEHAALYAALCRAAGLPCRTVTGLVYDEGAFGYHVWNEVHAGGRWLPVDTTFARFGLPALYIAFGVERPAVLGGGADVETRALLVRHGCTRLALRGAVYAE